MARLSSRVKHWFIRNGEVALWTTALAVGVAVILTARLWRCPHVASAPTAIPGLGWNRPASPASSASALHPEKPSWAASLVKCLRRPSTTAAIQLTSPLAGLVLSPWLFHRANDALTRRMAVHGRKWWFMGGRMGRRYEWYIIVARHIRVENHRLAPKCYKATAFADGRLVGWWNGLDAPMHASVISAQCAADNYCADGRYCEVGFGQPQP